MIFHDHSPVVPGVNWSSQRAWEKIRVFPGLTQCGMRATQKRARLGLSRITRFP